jgi:hypothetical protein
MKNVNLPRARVYIRADAFGGNPNSFEPAWLVSVRPLRGRPFAFQAWVDAYAACYDKIPPHCLYWRRPGGDGDRDNSHSPLPLHLVQMWECLSNSVEAWRKDMLADVPVRVNLGGGRTMDGHYWLTLDHLPEGSGAGMIDIGDTELLEEHKEANLIRLANGQIAIYPNNRIKWMPASLTPADAADRKPEWDVATSARWDEWWDDPGETFGDSRWAY